MKKVYKLAIQILINLIPVLAIFWPYLVQKRSLVFIDVGEDFLLNIWPMYKHFSSLLSDGILPIYSLNLGLGTNLFMGSLVRTSIVDPFAWILFLNSGNNFVTLIPWIIAFKILFSGLLFSYFLRQMKISYWSSIIGGLLFSLSAQMLVRVGWYHYTTEMVFIPLFLIAITIFFRKSIPIYLFLSVLWLSFYHSYYVVVYFIFATLWFVHLFFTEKEVNLKIFFNKISRFISVFVIGVLVGSVVFIPNLFNIISSIRVGSKLDIFSLQNIFIDDNLFVTIISRFFSSELLGFAPEFTGWQNTLEAPILYFGLVSLVILSVAYFYLSKKEQKIFLISFAFAFAYLFIPIITQLVNGSYGLRYKTSAFFITVLSIFYTVKTLDAFVKKNKMHIHSKIKISLLSFLPQLILLLLYFKVMYFEDVIKIEQTVLHHTFFFLLCYSLLINLKLYGLIKNCFIGTVLVLVTFELIVFGRFTIQNRESLSVNDVTEIYSQSEELKEIVQKISLEDTSFYRIEKDFGIFGSAYPNDSAAIGYPGTGIYHSFNHKSFASFTNSLGILDDSFEYRFFSGFSDDDIALRRLLNVKYYITENDHKSIDEYELLFTHGSKSVWFDPYAIDFGTVFSMYTKYSDIENAATQDEKNFLLTTIALENDLIIDSSYVQSFSTLNKSDTKNELLDFTEIYSIDSASVIGSIDVSNAGVMLIPILFDDGWRFKVNGSYKEIQKVNYGLMGVFLDEGSYEFELYYEQPYLKLGTFITIISLCGILCVMIFKYRTKAS